MDSNRIRRIVAPTAKPVTLADAKRQLAIVGTDDDALITSLIDAATAMVDGPNGIGIALCQQTYRMTFDRFASVMTLPVNPVRAITSIEYHDLTGTQQTLTDFRTDLDSDPARLYLSALPLAQLGSIKVTYVAGFDEVPADLRQAILMLVGHLYENREATSTVKLETVPLAVETILARYRA